MMRPELNQSKRQRGRGATRLTALVALVFVASCSTQSIKPAYRSKFKVERPQIVACTVIGEAGVTDECACTRFDHFLDILIELESRCIALGGSTEDCILRY